MSMTIKSVSDELGLSPAVMELIDRIAVLLQDVMMDDCNSESPSDASGGHVPHDYSGAVSTLSQDKRSAQGNGECGSADKQVESIPSTTKPGCENYTEPKRIHNPVRPYPAVVLRRERQDQERTANLRTDIHRDITLCRRCELAVRRCGKYILRKSRTERVGRVRSCGVCHTRTRCDQFEIGPLMPERGCVDDNDGN